LRGDKGDKGDRGDKGDKATNDPPFAPLNKGMQQNWLDFNNVSPVSLMIKK
jgi:hypothetical protein